MRRTLTTEDIEQQLRQLELPVTCWRVRLGEDAMGNDAIWVWATLPEDEFDEETSELVRSKVRAELRRVTDEWVYVRFASDNDEVVDD